MARLHLIQEKLNLLLIRTNALLMNAEKAIDFKISRCLGFEWMTVTGRCVCVCGVRDGGLSIRPLHCVTSITRPECPGVDGHTASWVMPPHSLGFAIRLKHTRA